MSGQTTKMSLPNDGLRCKRFDARSDSGSSQIALATALRNTDYFTAAMNLGKYLSHWIVVAWSEGATGHVVDYGQIEVASEDLGVEQAIMVAMREFRDQAEHDWPIATDGDPHETDDDVSFRKPDHAWIDAGYMTDVVYSFCRESKGSRFRPAVGRGAAQQRRQYYSRPTKTSSQVRHVGQGYHISLLASARIHLVEVDADHWKTWVHQYQGVRSWAPAPLPPSAGQAQGGEGSAGRSHTMANL